MRDEKVKRRVYGRRQGRALRSARQEALDYGLSEMGIADTYITGQQNIHPQDIFGLQPHNLWMEIGFGTGEHLIHLIENFPDTHFIGAEPFVNGMAMFLKDLPTGYEDRTRVYMDDALLLVHSLVDRCVDKFYILNPDPWPKTRHHKRRIISQENLDAFARILKPGAQIVMATDVDDLAEWIVTQFYLHPKFKWTAESQSDWQTPPPEWIETRFAFKGKQAGRRQSFLIFERLGV